MVSHAGQRCTPLALRTCLLPMAACSGMEHGVYFDVICLQCSSIMLQPVGAVTGFGISCEHAARSKNTATQT